MMLLKGLPQWLSGKESTCYVGEAGLVFGLERSPGGGHGNSPQYPWWENLVDRGAWWATVHGITKSQTWQKQLSLHSHKALKTQWFIFIFLISFIIQIALSSKNSVEWPQLEKTLRISFNSDLYMPSFARCVTWASYISSQVFNFLISNSELIIIAHLLNCEKD